MRLKLRLNTQEDGKRLHELAEPVGFPKASSKFKVKKNGCPATVPVVARLDATVTKDVGP